MEKSDKRQNKDIDDPLEQAVSRRSSEAFTSDIKNDLKRSKSKPRVT